MLLIIAVILLKAVLCLQKFLTDSSESQSEKLSSRLAVSGVVAVTRLYIPPLSQTLVTQRSGRDWGG